MRWNLGSRSGSLVEYTHSERMWRSISSRTTRLLLITSIAVNLLLLIRALLSQLTTTSNTDVNLSPSIRPPPLINLPPPAPRRDVAYNVSVTPVNSLDAVIFVGGVPRSGTTLARAMLDAHPDIRCGEESRVIPRIIAMRGKWTKSDKEHSRLLEAGLSDQTLDEAVKAFVDHIIRNHGDPAKHLCNKDPLLLNYMHDLHRLYPKARFLLMVRDGRAVAYSIVSRNITISGVNNKDYMSAALFWNRVVQRMVADCTSMGRRFCLRVRYEDLVTQPRRWMKEILQFLGIHWHENVLNHQMFINKGVSLSKLEPSSNQVKEAVNTVAIGKWREKLPSGLEKRMYGECTMLRQLGYPPPESHAGQNIVMRV